MALSEYMNFTKDYKILVSRYLQQGNEYDECMKGCMNPFEFLRITWYILNTYNNYDVAFQCAQCICKSLVHHRQYIYNIPTYIVLIMWSQQPKKNVMSKDVVSVCVSVYFYRFFRIVRSYDLLVQHQYYKVFERE